MDHVVIDASVAVKWLLDEDSSSEARALLELGYAFSVPELFFAEIGNVLWKRVRRGDVTAEEGERFVELIHARNFTVHAIRPIIPAAFRFAITHGITVYDACYVLAAQRSRTRVVTADRKFYDAVRKTALRGSISWIADERPALM